MFKTFNEYINNKKQLVEKPEEKLVPDYDGPQPKAPEGGAAPYKAANDDADPNPKKEKGLVDQGDQKIPDPQGKPLTPAGKNYPKSESFFTKTKKMSNAQFAKHMLETNNYKVDKSKLPSFSSNQPFPLEAVNYVIAASQDNNKILENLMHEVRRSGLAKEALKTLLIYPEVFQMLAELLNENSGLAKKHLKQACEAVGPPLDLGDEDEDHESPEHGHDDEDMDHDDEDGDENDFGSDDDEDEDDSEDSDDDMPHQSHQSHHDDDDEWGDFEKDHGHGRHGH